MTITLTAAHRTTATLRGDALPWRAPTRVAPAVVDFECGLARSRSQLREVRFAALRAALDATGGCVTADRLAERLRAHWNQPMSRVARWVVDRRIVSLTWQAQIWIPLFQFERPSLDVIPAVPDVVAELRREYDDWELAEWFARSHEALGGRAPAQALASTPCAVRAAARMDRFVSRW